LKTTTSKKRGGSSDTKLFVIKKYVLAGSVSEALQKEKKELPDDVWLEEGFKNKMIEEVFNKNKNKIGF
jgi:hypothetical protein